jgi:hypothetical protein
MGLFDKPKRKFKETVSGLDRARPQKKPQKVNLNDLAREITLMEGGSVNLPIGQVKEVLKLAFTHLAQHDLFDVALTLQHYKNKE